jgi:hypothetical protein
MKTLTLISALAGMLALSTQVFAQSGAGRPSDDAAAKPPTPAAEGNPASTAGAGSSAAAKSKETFTHGESKRCESLSGAAKDLCDKEEATKAEGQQAEELSKKPQDAPKQ